MRLFFSSLPGNIAACFKGRMILWHLTAIALTVLLVETGLDWHYAQATREFRSWAFSSARVGFYIPVLLPLMLLICSGIAQSRRLFSAALAIIQAELLGSLISSTYKFFTGRAHPSRSIQTDLTHAFKFGFYRGGVFWGWPSSHTTIAFAMALAIYTLFPKRRWIGIVAILYASYVGIGVSMTIHWLSDFVAGTIIGSVIGVVVGRTFLASLQADDSSGGGDRPGPS